MKSVYRITEYSSFIPDRHVQGYVTLPGHTFEQLENFLLLQKNARPEGLDFLSLSARKGIGKIITARNYVGVIAMNDGTCLEILPKLHDVGSDEERMKRARALLLAMLKALPTPPFKSLHAANLKSEKLSIFEAFIAMFVEELILIVKRGLRSRYETVEENAAFFRGKMNFSRQMTRNHVHKERCFMEHDEFIPNRPENRLIKATLQHLRSCSHTLRNRNNIKILLSHFADVDASTDFETDFARSSSGRDMREYATVLPWCRIFLSGRSFTPFTGPDVALALLFPMDTLFERYMAVCLKAFLRNRPCTLSVQDKRFCLFDEPRKLFPLRPDMVVTRLSDNAVIILDTKWKRLDVEKPQCGISQSDMYQMFAYHKIYKAEKVLLLYPSTEHTPTAPLLFTSHEYVAVQVLCLDLLQMPRSLERIGQALGL